MRRVNGWLSLAIIVLLLVHAIAGGYQLAGILPGGNQVLTALAWVLVALIVLHAVLGTILTMQSVRTSRQAGRFYGRENAAFVVRRVSGFAILFFAACHVVIFYGNHSGGYRLNVFEGPQLALSICLVASLAVHLLCNIKPLFISLGLRWRARRVDAIIILAAVLVFCTAMFCVYYYRWNVGWMWNIQLGR